MKPSKKFVMATSSSIIKEGQPGHWSCVPVKNVKKSLSSNPLIFLKNLILEFFKLLMDVISIVNL